MEMVKNENIVVRFLKDVFTGWGWKEGLYAWTLVLLQIVFYMIYPDSTLGFITGVSGTITVLLVAKGKISNYFFGFIQTGIALILGFQAGLIGETGENLFYFVSQFLGLREWSKNMVEDKDTDGQTQVVETRKLTLKEWFIVALVVIVPTIVLGTIFLNLNGTQPYIDAGTLILALVSTALMIKRYREQWLGWILLNVLSIYQWYTLGNMSLVAMYIAFIINSVYGFVKWSKEQKQINA